MIVLYGFNPLVLLKNFHCKTYDFYYEISLKFIQLLKMNNIEFELKRKLDPHKNTVQIHYGIISSFKTYKEYKHVFFGHFEGFYGISVNIFQDSNLGQKQNKIIMLSIGSWNCTYRHYLPTKRDVHLKYLTILNRHVNNYRMNPYGLNIVLFVQNYSPSEYWFGWTNEDIEIWVQREMKNIEKIKHNCNKKILIKFHPKTENTYKEYMKQRIHEKDILNIEFIDSSIDLDTLLIDEKLYCCVVNSGTVVIEACLRGIPCFYIDDYYSNIPMNKYCLSIDRLNSFTIIDLPSQATFLDFICSQCFIIEENLNDLLYLLK